VSSVREFFVLQERAPLQDRHSTITGQMEIFRISLPLMDNISDYQSKESKDSDCCDHAQSRHYGKSITFSKTTADFVIVLTFHGFKTIRLLCGYSVCNLRTASLGSDVFRLRRPEFL
jgi:hypothetical protein